MFSSCLMQGCTPAHPWTWMKVLKAAKKNQKTSEDWNGLRDRKTSKFQHLSFGNMWKTSQKRTGIRTNRKVSDSYRWYEMMLRPKRLYCPLVAAFRATAEQICVDVPSSLLFRRLLMLISRERYWCLGSRRPSSIKWFPPCPSTHLDTEGSLTDCSSRAVTFARPSFQDMNC